MEPTADHDRVPRALVNPQLDLSAVPAPPDAEVRALHRSMPGYAPTPLHALPQAAGELGLAQVLLKDESDRFGLPAFKILGASWAVARALRDDPEVRTLVAASAGNHGRAVARCAARRGLTSRVYLPAGASAARREAIAAEGAQVVTVDGDYDAAVVAAARQAEEPGAALIADVAYQDGSGSAAWVIDGYATLFREVGEQLTSPVDLVLVPVGVGSLAAAALRWAAHEGGRPTVVGVEPRTAACVTASLQAGRPVTVATPGTAMAGLDCGTPSTVAWPTLAAGMAGTVTVDDAEVHTAMRDLARSGLALGDCGAAALAALRALATDERCGPLRTATGLGRRTRVLCVGTEGPSGSIPVAGFSSTG